MKKKKRKTIIFLGILCVLAVAVSSWYAIVFNDARLVAPMDFSEYTFRMKDLPMLISITALALYIICLFILLIREILANKQKEAVAQFTRRVNPKWGFFGFFGFFGFLGFWTYSVDKTIFPFIFFMFFGFFGFFYEGKMSDILMDERYQENKMKAHMTANRIALGIIFVSTLFLGQGKLIGNLEYTLIAVIIVISLSIALEVFLGEYLLYRYDLAGQFEESEE